MSEDEGVYHIPVPEPDQEWTTCYIVGIDREGNAVAAADVEKFLEGKAFDRLATTNDMWIGAAQVKRVLEEIQLVQRMMNAQFQMAHQMAQQADAQRLTQKLDIPGSRNF